MKRLIMSLFVVIMLLLLLSRCLAPREEPYEFRQEFDQIQAIEIVHKEYHSANADTPVYVVKTLDKGEYQAICDAIVELDRFCPSLDPPTGFGDYLVRITYMDGEIEIIGNWSSGYISKDGKIHDGGGGFDSEQYYEMISEFVGEEITEPTLG